jgi:hypothetical protein
MCYGNTLVHWVFEGSNFLISVTGSQPSTEIRKLNSGHLRLGTDSTQAGIGTIGELHRSFREESP